MSEPQANTPPSQAPHHFPNLGVRVPLDATSIKPETADADKPNYTLQQPGWLPDSINLGAPDAPRSVEQTAPHQDTALLPPPTMGPPPGYRWALEPEPAAPQADAPVTYSAPDQSPAPVFAQPAPLSISEAAHQHAAATRPSASVPQPTPGPRAGTVRVPGQPLQHPVVAELLQQFGLKKTDIHTFDALGHTFVIREANSEILQFCIGQGSKMAVSDADLGTRVRNMVAALSVISIDNVPVVELFPWNKTSIRNAASIDPLWPPFTVTVLVAEHLFRLFFESMKSDVISKIAEEYDVVYGGGTEPEDTTRAPLITRENDKRVRFKCNVAGCGHVEDVEPIVLGDDLVQARFCPAHGVELTPLGYTRDMVSLPLE
jgi:hypothetical protein